MHHESRHNFHKMTVIRNYHYVAYFDYPVALHLRYRCAYQSKTRGKIARELPTACSAMHFVTFVIIEYFEAQKAFHLKIRYINM